jgi:hypothetical protein
MKNQAQDAHENAKDYERWQQAWQDVPEAAQAD